MIPPKEANHDHASWNRVTLPAYFAVVPRVLMGAEVVLYERSIPDEFRDRFEFSIRETKLRHGITLEQIRKENGPMIGNPWVPKVVACTGQDGGFEVLRMTIIRSKAIKILYERQLPQEDLQRYRLEETTGPSPGEETSLEDVEADYGQEYWEMEWGVRRVEVYYEGDLEGKWNKKPRLRVFRLNPHPIKTDAEKKEGEEWIKMAKETLAVGKDSSGFRHMDTDCKVLAHWDLARGDGPIPYGLVRERFGVANGGEIMTSIDQWKGATVLEHEFVRDIVND